MATDIKYTCIVLSNTFKKCISYAYIIFFYFIPLIEEHQQVDSRLVAPLAIYIIFIPCLDFYGNLRN